MAAERKSADDGGCFEVAATSSIDDDDEQTDGDDQKPVRLKVLTKLENLTEADESMESNSLPPTTPTYPPGHPPSATHHSPYPPGTQQPAYAYGPDGTAHYRVEVVPGYETHSNAQSYYYTSYVTETPADPRYVLEQPPSYYNGYGPPPSSSGGYPMHSGGYSTYQPVGMPAYDQRSQMPPQRTFHDPNVPNGAAGRNLPLHPAAARPLGPPPPVHQPLNSTITADAAEGKKLTKKRSSASTHSVTSLPIDAPIKVDPPKKQFQCPECSKCVSSLRNLNRHQTSCKARKEKKGGESSAGGSPQKSFEASNSPPKRPKQPPPPKAEPQSAPPVHHNQPTYHVYVPEGAPPVQPLYHPPPTHQYAPQYAPPPHTALPQSGSQTMFEYPPHNTVQGMSSGLHSAPPTVNFPPSGPSYAQGARFEAQRSMDYVEDPYSYGNSMPVDSFIDASIDEMAHNPLAFIGSPAAQSSSGPSYETSGPANAEGRPTSFAALQPVPMRNPAAVPAQQERPKMAEMPPPLATIKAEPSASEAPPPKKKKGERKNSEPTPYRCEACQRYMCSSRSLRRHRSTCKQYLQTAQLTTEDKLLIAKQEENKCENCGKILQSPSNLRRHRAACKQKSEEEPRPAAGSPTSRDSTDSATADSESNAQKRLQPPPEAQETPSNAAYPPSAPPSNSMPPPSMNSSGPLSAPPTTLIYVKQEESFQGPSVYVDSQLTVGEHLRQHIGPNQQAAKRGAPKKPLIIGRKASLQNPEHQMSMNVPPATCPPTAFHNPLASPPPDFHAHSAPPVVEPPHFANGQEELEGREEKMAERVGGVVETVDQVVEKIRRQNAEQQGGALKRPNPPTNNETTPPAKMMRTDKPKPLAIITTQPLQPMWRGGVQPAQVRPPTTNVLQQPPPPQRPIQTAPPAQPGAACTASVIIARYLCMECLKYYACRKNLRAHRMNAHELTEEAVDAEGPPPRLKVRLDGEIVTAGYDQENLRIRKARASGTLIPPTVAKNNTKANGGGTKRNSAPNSAPPPTETKQEQPSFDVPQTTLPPPHSAPPMPPQSHHYYMAAGDPQTSVDPSTPQYESLQPMRMEFGSSQYSNGGPPHAASHFEMADDLDFWDQIRPNIEKPFDPTATAGDDEIDRIAADLKRSAEATQRSPRPVVQAEPDSTTDDPIVSTNHCSSSMPDHPPSESDGRTLALKPQ